MMTRHPPAPSHLSPESKTWWKAVLADFDLEAHHLKLLRLACEAYDRTQTARQAIDRDGITVTSDTGAIKAHPAIAIERDSRLAFARLLRELDLDTTGPDTPRPPAIRSNRG